MKEILPWLVGIVLGEPMYFPVMVVIVINFNPLTVQFNYVLP